MLLSTSTLLVHGLIIGPAVSPSHQLVAPQHVTMRHAEPSRQPWMPHLVAACAALTVGFSPLDAAGVPSELQLAVFGDSSLVESGLKEANMEGDLRMIKLWARLKSGELDVEGKKAANKAEEQQSLASARMRVRSLAPYLDEAERDIFSGKWKVRPPIAPADPVYTFFSRLFFLL